MKKIALAFLMLICISTQAQKIRVLVGIDSVTNKTIKAQLNSINFDVYGNPTVLFYDLNYYEVTDSVVVPSGTELKRKALSQKTLTFVFSNVYIDPVSKLYTTSSDVAGVEVNKYFRLKAINTYSGLGGSKNMFDYLEAILKEVIEIKKANAEF